MSDSHITPERLREVLSYDPETGDFRWKVSRGGVRAGVIAGTIGNHNYRQIRIDRRRYLAHRLAWFYTYGQWPDQEIDHINGVRDDNRLSNLRAATRSEQNRNHVRRSDNSSNYTGVSWCSRERKWMAYIVIHGKHTHLGYFDGWPQACLARFRANRKYGFHENHGRTQEQRAED